MSWRDVLDAVDAVESWIVGQPYWLQISLLLVVLLPVGWALAGLIDRIVERILAPHTRREMRFAAQAVIAHGQAGPTPDPHDAGPAESTT